MARETRNGKYVDWYWWANDKEFDKKCKDSYWRSRLREMVRSTYYQDGWDQSRIEELEVTSYHISKLGFHVDLVDDFVYREAVREFQAQYLIPDSKIRLTPKQVGLFAWGVEQGLPLLVERR